MSAIEKSSYKIVLSTNPVKITFDQPKVNLGKIAL